LAAVDIDAKEIKYYDYLSKGTKNYDATALGRKCLNTLLKYLDEEHQAKRGSPLNTDEWKTTLMTDIPQQTNWSDCGMFVLKYAEYLSRRKRMSFTQADMPLFRRRTI
jgi:Ulp1 family protease